MFIIEARNVHRALPQGVYLLNAFGRREDTRNGPALVADRPVVTVYEKPRERVLYWHSRDANPFFHLFESLWMLAGRRDVAFVANFAKQMREYSDDGETFHGAYGWRWREHFGFDQLMVVIQELARDPFTRRVVLQMWDPDEDFAHGGKDLPCNTNAYFRARRDEGPRGLAPELDLTVCCRSNDIVWGAYGANAVHFSMLLEYVASALGMRVGRMYQLSNNYHGYLSTLEPIKGLGRHLTDDCPYELGYVAPGVELMEGLIGPEKAGRMRHEIFSARLSSFLEHPRHGVGVPFLDTVAWSMWRAWELWKEKRLDDALAAVELCHAEDWRRAGREWLARRARRMGIDHVA